MAVPTVTHTFTAGTTARAAQVNTNFTNIISALTDSTADLDVLTLNNITFTAPSSSATFTLANGKTLTMSNTLTFAGTDGSTVTCGAGGTVIYASNKLSALSATTSAELAGVISDETGSGLLVFATSPTLTTPTIGVATATSVNKMAITAPATSSTLAVADGKTLTCSNTLTFTGTDASSVAFGAGGTAAYTANKLSAFAATTSAELAGVISDETGSGALVFATSPSLVTPTIGVATATSINKVALTAPATSATLTIADGKTLTSSNTLTLAGTDSTTMTFPSSSATIPGLAIANTFTVGQVIDGTADEIQHRIQGNATQTSDILVVEKSDGTDLLQVTNVNGTKIRGSTTNDDAAVGFVGEILKQSRVLSAATALTSATTANITASTITLTAGDWIIRGAVSVQGASGTTVSSFATGISTTSATLPGTDVIDVPTGAEIRQARDGYGFTSGAGSVTGVVLPTYRATVASNTTIYLVANVTFAVSTLTGFGWYEATRIR